MINFKSVALRRGQRVLFENASFTIHKGEKVGITGANGTGKSSLFAAMLGRLPPEAGEISMPPGMEIAHVAQETPASPRTALEYALDGDRELRTIQTELESAEILGAGERVAHLYTRLEAIGGYDAPARAAKLLRGLGFCPGEENRAVAEFSGGWRMRLNLAQALMCRSDLLLLDEPTNHLDLDAVVWLQDWLSRYPGTLLLISHDRDFLDDLASHILHLEQRTATLYTGNYSAFEIRRAEILAQQQAVAERQQREIAHIRAFVDRFRAQATKARQVQSRLKALDRMELVARAQADSPFRFSFPEPEKQPSPLLQLDHVAAGYGATTILSGARLTLNPGNRIGLLGPNGAGKSTLVKLLAGMLEPLCGRRLPAQDLRVGYFAQHQLEQLDPEGSPLEHMQKLDPRATEKDLRSFLGGFGFSGDQALAEVAPFSGGERARLALALIVYRKPNLLLLDEPTNHLDLQARDALSLALQEYTGALVLVSHDRYLLRTVSDDLCLVADGQLQAFDGDLYDYVIWLNQRRNVSPDSLSTKGEETAKASRKDQRRNEAEQRRRLKPFRDALQRAEQRLDKLEADQRRLEELLADPALYQAEAKPRLQALLLEKTGLGKALAEVETEWLQAGEALDAALAAPDD